MRILLVLLVTMWVGALHAETVMINNTRGEYGEVKKNLDKYGDEHQMGQTFYMGKTRDVEVLEKKITKEPSRYTPFLLMAMGDRMVRDGDLENGLFWFHAGRMRGMYDAGICTDTSVLQSMAVLSMKMPKTVEAGLRNTDVLKKILPKAAEWEKSTPYDYDRRWISLSGAKVFSTYFNKDQEIGPLLKPEDEWEKIHETVIEKYLKQMGESIAEIEEAGGFEKYKLAHGK